MIIISGIRSDNALNSEFEIINDTFYDLSNGIRRAGSRNVAGLCGYQ